MSEIVAAVAETRAGNLYFLTLVVLLVVGVALATVNTIRKRRDRDSTRD